MDLAKGLPRFAKKKFCPGQTQQGSATSRKSTMLYKTLSRLNELITRAQRHHATHADRLIFVQTAKRCHRALTELDCPCYWHAPADPSLVQLNETIQWINQEIAPWESLTKKRRLEARRIKLKESAKSTKKFIFHHLRNKTITEPTNLVCDPQGNTIFNPCDAISTINNTWDEIYSANVLHQDPLQMLQVIWPYMDHEVQPWHLPSLTGNDLYITIQARNPLAAPGLDGWRTTDLQSLPSVCCDALASFFNALEDDCHGDLPQVLVRAKQVILNKPGPSLPLNKRLITVPSPLLLAYTGTRLRELKEWQQTVLPKQLYGGIPGRHMTDIPLEIRTQIDQAHVEGNSLVGIKLDQSKCFDRILPSFAGALFIAFGLPKGIVSIFLKVYQGLKKHPGWVQGPLPVHKLWRRLLPSCPPPGPSPSQLSGRLQPSLAWPGLGG